MAGVARAQVTQDGTFQTGVASILKWILSDETDGDSGATVDTWNVNDSGYGAVGSTIGDNTATADGVDTASDRYTDSVIVFRLVTNGEPTIDAEFDGPFTEGTSGASDTLATFFNIMSDGDGTGTDSTAGSDYTGRAWSAFAAENADAGIGGSAGTLYEFGRTTLNFVYIAGASAVTDSWRGAGGDGGGTGQTLTTPTVTGANYVLDGAGGAGGGTDWADNLTPFTGEATTHIARDGAIMFQVTVRAMNGEDFGNDSDLTEAPEVATDYQCTLTLTATP
ncbi:hypothetical protein FJZ36_09460 [Candidatus Poribacteria bacterium]|nr:hypothetical protein [Candidatus Poribacteria bacterium]